VSYSFEPRMWYSPVPSDTCMYVCMCIHVCMYVNRALIETFLHEHVRKTPVCMYVYVYMYDVYICMYIHIHAYMYTYTYIHTLRLC
jgi:hypothetical protein